LKRSRAIDPKRAGPALTAITNRGAPGPGATAGRPAPAGYGTSNFVAGTALLPYQIVFENDPTATAPAQRVDITDQLDPNLDWSTFQLAAVGFGSTYIAIPAGLYHYDTAVKVTENGEAFEVVITLNLDPATGLFTAALASIDPSTDLPPASLLTGLLPPEDGSGRGIGFVSFTVRPIPGLATGKTITNVADISFDTAPFIATDQVNDQDPSQGIDPNKQALVTIDSGPPTSSVGPLPATSPPNFTVSWSGQDDAKGSGIAFFDIWVSTDGGMFQPFLLDTTQTSATFPGQPGHTYAFYSVATDNVGNREPTPTAAEASTLVLATGTTTAVTSDHPLGSVYGQTVVFTATVGADDPNAGTPTGSVQFQIDGANFGSPVTLTAGTASITTASLPAGPHSVVALYTSESTNFANSDNTGSPLSQAVTPAPLTISADNQTMTYGSPLPTLTVSYAGLVNGDTPAVFTATGNSPPVASTTATQASDVVAGGYPITVSGAVDANYSITYVSGTLTITPADQTITWGNPADIIVGTALGATQLDATVAVVGPAAAGALSYTPAAGAVLGPGSGQALTVTAAATTDYNAATLSVSINVLYQFSGFLWPLNQTQSFPLFTTIPIRWRLTDVHGNLIHSLKAVTSLLVQPVYADGTPKGPARRPDSPGDEGVMYNPVTQVYVLRWETKEAGANYFRILLTLNDGTVHSTILRLTGTSPAAASGTDRLLAAPVGGGDLRSAFDIAAGGWRPAVSRFGGVRRPAPSAGAAPSANLPDPLFAQLGQGNIAIGGTTAYYRDVTAPASILAEWSRPDEGCRTRLADIEGLKAGGLIGGSFFSTKTFHDHGLADTLDRGPGMDWFFASLAGQDVLNGRRQGEPITKVGPRA
jgi:hypothetical protein